MRIITLRYNLATGELVADSFANITRRDGYQLHLYVHRNGSAELLPTDSFIAVVAKDRAEAGAAIAVNEWTAPSNVLLPYEAGMVVDGEVLDALFVDGEVERQKVELLFELSHWPSEEVAPTSSSRLELTVMNDFTRPTDVVLPPMQPSSPYALGDARWLKLDGSQTLESEQQTAIKDALGIEESGGGAWGEIEGTLADQVDLQAVLETIPASGAGGYLPHSSTTPFTRQLLNDADAAAAHSTLELGALATLGGVNNAHWSGTALVDGNIASASTWNGKLGGSTGSVDNALLRADDTGGKTVQGSAVVVTDEGAMGIGVAGEGPYAMLHVRGTMIVEGVLSPVTFPAIGLWARNGDGESGWLRNIEDGVIGYMTEVGGWESVNLTVGRPGGEQMILRADTEAVYTYKPLWVGNDPASGLEAVVITATEIKPVEWAGNRMRYYYTSTVWDGVCDGSPEGVETGGVGCTCRSLATGAVYRKTSGSGNTGWVTP